MNILERLTLAWNISKRIDTLDSVIAQIETLGSILDRLSLLEGKLKTNASLESLAYRLESLDRVVKNIETLSQPKAPVSNGVIVHPAKQDLLEWNRLKLLSKFVQLADKGKEIEQEWQRIQQDEHDYQFAFHTDNNEETQAKYMYKKGITEGVKWCVSRFS